MYARIGEFVDGFRVRQLRRKVIADPVGTAAQKHIHRDITRMDVKVAAFRSARPRVQQRVLAELDLRVEQGAPGTRSPALATLLTVAGTGLAVYAAISAALTGGFFTAAAPLQDASGRLHVQGAAEAMKSISEMTGVLIGAAIVVIAVAALAWALAMGADRQRAAHATWARVYRHSAERQYE
ncbi:hypothetical protein [uncultured Leifsonia sp.]|uniref:hypothetical protein n=1 Tax=uncultured Leifsonia sp. TaxID=340359 RepID=UPI0028D7E3B4|nr:hypothetical protein [uncultured Leifsonia sp.]